LGIDIPAITSGPGQIAAGPAISSCYITDGNVVMDIGLCFEGIADILNTADASGLDNPHGCIEGTIDLSLPGGARIGLPSASAKLSVNLPMQ